MEVSLGANKASYGNDKNFRNEEFYSPICLSGYLTPLQRKKLREKRNLLFEDVLDSHSAKLTNAKKLLGSKRKKGNTSNETSKKRLKVKKSKELIPQIQCQVSRIVLKASNSNEKDRKFFKTSSLSRLEKANFTLSLEFKKSVLNIGKCVEPASYAGKRFVKECTKVIESSNDSTRTIEIGKENSPEDCSSFTSDVSFDSESGPVSDSSRERSVFDFDWPSDEDLVRRQERARASLRSLNDSRKSVIPEKENKVEEEPSLDRKY